MRGTDADGLQKYKVRFSLECYPIETFKNKRSTSYVKPRIAFDLDETLGTAITDGYSLTGFNIRQGCADLLDRLGEKYELVLWTVSSRIYVEKALNFGLRKYFAKSCSWDEISCDWKDIRRINAEFLIDDDIHHKEMARLHNLESRYIIIPAYGTREDQKEPLLWVRQIWDHIQFPDK